MTLDFTFSNLPWRGLCHNTAKPARTLRLHLNVLHCTVIWGLRLQALVYDILPLTTAIVDYAIGLGKLSANEQFFDDARMAATL